MFSPWRLMLCKAEQALKMGQLKEAGQLVTKPEARSFAPVRQLRGKVASALTRRARGYLENGDSERAWADLLEAEQLGAGGETSALRSELSRSGLGEAGRYLDDGQPEAALRWLARLRHRGVEGADCRRLEAGASAWLAGRDCARRGHLGAALELYETARALLKDCGALEQCLAQARDDQQKIPILEGELLKAMSDQDWQAAMRHCEALEALAPSHSAAQAARRRAWQAVGVQTRPAGRGGRGDGTLQFEPSVVENGSGRGARAGEGARGSFRLWVDTVGGYLVCLHHRLSIGQPGRRVDIALMAELARLHAWIERSGDTYLLRSVRPCVVNGGAIGEQALLSDGDEIILGQGVRLLFRRPNPLSSTARLDIESRQRFAFGGDAVLLMGRDLAVGPQASSHVVAPRWDRQVTLYRREDELWCRMAGEFEVDGRPSSGQARLSTSSRIKAEGLSMALEPATGQAVR